MSTAAQTPIPAPVRRPRSCMELGVCQSRTPACHDCEPRAMFLAPGVIDGPYRRTSVPAVWTRSASKALRMVVDYLMRPYP